MNSSLEQQTYVLGLELFKAIKNQQESIFDKQYWFGRMMEWVMKDPSFKVDLFRFVDVLPVLKTDKQVAQHIKEYLIDNHPNLPLLIKNTLKAASFSFTRGLASAAIRKNVSDLAERFILGANIKDATKGLLRLQEQGFSSTIDLLGEKALSNRECDAYALRYNEIIKTLPNIASYPDDDPPNVSIKVSALAENLREEDVEGSVLEAKKRIMPLLRLARENRVFVNFDVETWATHEIVYKLFDEIIRSEEFSSWPHLGIVVQAYLKDSPRHVQALIEASKARKSPIVIRLVKGAYWDYEVVKADLFGFQCPVFQEKAETDLNYEYLSRLLLDHTNILKPAFGSHNIRSLAQAIAYAESINLPKSAYEIQMLYGMAESERTALLRRGLRVRLYVPIGEMIPGMSYLVRRLLENTSQMGFVKMSRHDQVAEEELLKKPVAQKQTENKKTMQGFINEPTLDFTEPEIRKQFAENIQYINNNLPMHVPVMISGVKERSLKTMERVSPNDKNRVIARVDLADVSLADKAILESMTVFSSFRDSSLKERASHLLKLAELLKKDFFLLSALICHEVGKTWNEAAADVAEAIDFCRYYALKVEEELSPQRLGSMAGEENLLVYQGRGPTVIIAPWNFPVAIITGMSVAAYASGNPIIIKPAEQSSLTAWYLYERMLKAGFIKEACHFLPGIGEEIGAYLVEHPLVANICFTGSKAVGHKIMQSANTVSHQQIQMKRVITEMGGKNAIIIDDDADLDEAVLAILKSAFLYAGQKCSAASRVIAIGSIKEQLIQRLVDATASIVMGSSLLPGTFMGPVIDEEAYQRLNSAINKLRQDPTIKLLYQGSNMDKGFFVPPLIVETTDASHWVMQEELFGPVLAIYAASDLEQALKIANSTRYALTGAIFSRSPKNIAKARVEFQVGNLYINQKCTGALVNRQPFGGFKMSGTGIKAGGPHYMLHFVDSRAISENTIRRGFAPEI